MWSVEIDVADCDKVNHADCVDFAGEDTVY